MMFHQSSRRNAVKHVLLSGVGATTFSSVFLAATKYYAGAENCLKLAVMPAIVSIIFSVLYFVRRNFTGGIGHAKIALNPVGNFKLTSIAFWLERD
ncbi:MAG TPA: hypothetical protein VM935_06135 [Chitinophagaceae bacterium]|nr:hypothetical protein [Chitinophagaceae bacterium]